MIVSNLDARINEIEGRTDDMADFRSITPLSG
jgi:hypothetical protein